LVREIKGSKPRYGCTVDREKKLSELVYEDEMKNSLKVKTRVVKAKKKRVLISCEHCEKFTKTRVVDGKVMGTFNCGGHCIHL